jgi:uncharacterized membrane protein YfcA
MLLILEIVLTIIAFRKGWRWKALIPLAVLGGLGAVVGVAIAANGYTQMPNEARAFLVVGDVICCIWLAVMVAKAKNLPSPTPSGPSSLVP